MSGHPGQTEAQFQEAIIELAETTGWLVYHVANSKTVIRNETGKGFPDLVIVGHGRLLFAELKVGDNKPTATQREWLKALRRAGAEQHIWKPEDWPEIEFTLKDSWVSPTHRSGDPS